MLWKELDNGKMFKPNKFEVTGEWRKLHNEELGGLQSQPIITQRIKSRWMGWAAHVAYMTEKRNA